MPVTVCSGRRQMVAVQLQMTPGGVSTAFSRTTKHICFSLFV